MKKYSVIETTEGGSLEIKKISGDDPQEWHPQDTEKSVIEDAIIWYYEGEEIELEPHFYGSFRASWLSQDGEDQEGFFVVRYEEEEEE